MENQTETELKENIKNSMTTIFEEHTKLKSKIRFEEIAVIVPILKKANRIFFLGMGRSGFMMNAVAMRFMHLGFKAYVVGETTTPAIAEGDLLIAGSGSGTTGTVVKAVVTAKEVGASVIGITTDSESPLASKADYTVIIPAAAKQKHKDHVSRQYAGSLFEQALLLTSDALIQTLWDLDGSTSAVLNKRHSNLE